MRKNVKSQAAGAAAQKKADRKNSAKMAQKRKRQEIVDATRVFAGLHGAPRIIAVVPLCSDVSACKVAQSVAESVGIDSSACPEYGHWTVACVTDTY